VAQDDKLEKKPGTRGCELLTELDEGGALAAFVLGGFGDGGYVGVRLEEVADAAAEDTGAVAVDDADAGETGEEGTVKILLQIFSGFVDGAADEVDLHAHFVGVGAGDGDVDAFLFAGVGQGVGFLRLPRICSRG
jgi:hypothetical protein